MKKITILLTAFTLFFNYSCLDQDVLYETIGNNSGDDGGSGGGGGTSTILKQYKGDFGLLGYATIDFDATGKLTKQYSQSVIDIPLLGTMGIINDTTFARNTSGNIQTITSTLSSTISGITTTGTEVSTLTYNTSGQITKITCVETGNPTETLDLTYSGTTVNGVYKIGSTTIANIVYTFDAEGKILSRISTTSAGTEYKAVVTYTAGNVTKLDHYEDNLLDYSDLNEYDTKTNPIHTQTFTDYKAMMFNNIFSELDEEAYTATPSEIIFDNSDIDGGEVTLSLNNITTTTSNGVTNTFTLNYNSNNLPTSGTTIGATLTYTYY